jgi:hypothetical protein
MLLRSLPAASLAALAAAAGCWIAAHHPLSPPLALAAFGVATALAVRWPALWLVALPVLLPLVGLAPWSGWITFEEADLLVLAAAAAGYARWAVKSAAVLRAPAGRASALVALVIALMGMSVLIGLWRGVADAGGWRFGWFQGYLEPMASVRLAKPFVWALLLLPLWRRAIDAGVVDAMPRLSLGMTLGLAGVGLAVLWERLAYTGLTNFSSDYRVSALFWEMHVGGAALDGYLALALPFAIAELSLARHRARWLLAAGALLLGAYAALTTFSRALYVALPAAALLLVVLQARQRAASAATAPGGLAAAALLLLGFGVCAAWLFPAAGYRGLLALWGAFALLLLLAPRLAGGRRGDATRVLVASLLACAGVLLVAWALPKGPYIAYAVAWSATALLLLAARGRVALAAAGYAATLVALVAVALHWGEGPGLRHALPVALLLAALPIALAWRRAPPWPEARRWQAGVFGLMGTAIVLVGVFGGGSYMSERFAGEGKRLGGRLGNWTLGLAALDDPVALAFGRGLGRFPAHYHAATSGSDRRPGDLRVVSDPGGTHLVLSAGTHPLGWLELLRLSQRISPPSDAPILRFSARADRAASLHFELCEKHLLYSERCLTRVVAVPATAQRQPMQVALDAAGALPERGAWYAPRFVVFSIAAGQQGTRVEIDDLALTDARGRNLLANGGFDDEFAHWLPTSDGYHWPWHIEGWAMSALFDQGLVGLTLLLLLWGGALWRVSAGSARGQPHAPALAAALLGAALAGAASSVTDVPRVALLLYLMMLVALRLPDRRSRRSGVASARAPGQAAALTSSPQPEAP